MNKSDIRYANGNLGRLDFKVEEINNKSLMRKPGKNIIKRAFLFVAVIISSKVSAEGIKWPSENKGIYVQAGLRLIDDRSRNSNYTLEKYGMRPSGFHTMYGTWRPGFAVGLKDSITIFGKMFVWDNSVGFQSAGQNYHGRYGETISDSSGGSFEHWQEYVDPVVKYYIYCRSSLDVPIAKHFYVSPLVQYDYRIGTKIPPGPIELALFGVYDFQNNNLDFHRKFNVKIGLQFGYSITSNLDVSIAYLEGMNESIYVEAGHPWKNIQKEVNISYKL